MGVLEGIRQRAAKLQKTIVLPEGFEPRIIEAAAIATESKVSKVILLGNPEQIRSNSKGVDLSGVEIIDYLNSDKMDLYAKELFELRKHKGITIEDAGKMLKDPLYYAVMMVKMGDADGMVAGSINSTADVLRPALQIIKTAPGIRVVSSVFFIELPTDEYGHKGTLIFGDCGVNPDPNAEELAAIAVSTARTAKQVALMEPVVALLSYSTKGSAVHPRVDKVIEATKLAKQMAPEFMIDGELQGDAALVEKVGRLKCPDSQVAGRANVLVFPDLDSGNIAYKLTQYLAGAQAVGPICQGFAKPINDLSRGCSPLDVMNAIAITAVQAEI
ncbi:MAG: phosphate acetyltransferase [Caldicoprobacterales bacterium]|jgi:phosphate acetyltransferase|nr:phosphate acetyltransferase [Clostridia bacterium]